METLDEKNSGGMSEKAFHDITGTAQWLKITAMIAMAIMAIGILFLLYAMTLGAGGVGLVMIILYGAFLALYYVLLKQGNALTSFGTSRSSADLEEFAKNFKTFWTVIGVLSIIGAVAYLILMLLALSGGGMRMF